MIKEDKPLVLEFPKLDTISLADVDIQKELIKWGAAVGMPGGEMICIKAVKLVAGGVK